MLENAAPQVPGPSVCVGHHQHFELGIESNKEPSELAVESESMGSGQGLLSVHQ